MEDPSASHKEDEKDKGYDHFVKVVIVGDSAVGKTNLMLRFATGQYVVTHMTTIGIDFKVKTLIANQKKIKMQMWDTAGQDRFRTITKTYYRGSAGIVLVYSVSDRKSFNNIEAWMSQLEQNAPEDVNRIIVANKVDCTPEEREVTKEEGEELATKYGVVHIEASAKEDIGVAEIFETLAKQIADRLGKMKKSEMPLIAPSKDTTQKIAPVPTAPPVVNKQPQKFQLKGEKKDPKKKKKSCC